MASEVGESSDSNIINHNNHSSNINLNNHNDNHSNNNNSLSINNNGLAINNINSDNSSSLISKPMAPISSSGKSNGVAYIGARGCAVRAHLAAAHLAVRARASRAYRRAHLCAAAL